MRFKYLSYKLSLILFIILLFFTSCNQSEEVRVFKEPKVSSSIYVAIMPFNTKNLFVKLHIKDSEMSKRDLSDFKEFCDSFKYDKDYTYLFDVPINMEKIDNDQFSSYRYRIASLYGTKIVSISELPSFSITSNVNRCRRQIGLNPITENEATLLLQDRINSLGKYQFIEIINEK